MLHGPLLKKILLFALPLALSGILQQLFNSADVAVIGWFEDSNAQAAVNSNGSLINLLINLFTGLSVGVTVVIAEYIGRDDKEDIHSVVLTAAVIAFASGVLLLAVGIIIAKPVLTAMDVPEEVLPLAVKYLQVYFIGMPFLMIYNFGSAILRSVGDTRRPLYCLTVAGIINIALNLLFVAVFKMSVVGVAIATVVADAVSAGCVVFFIMKNETLRIRFKKSKIKAKYLRRIFAIGLPAGLQGIVFSLSNVCIQTAINGFGDKAMAGSGDALYFEYYVYYFVSSFAQATVTFISQNYAAGNYARCKKIFKLNMLASLAVTTVLSLTFALGGKLFIRIYTSDPEVIQFALIRMICVLSGEMIPSTYEIAGGALRGIGKSLLPALITVVGSCVLRIIWVYTVFKAYSSNFYVLMIIYPISWIATGSVMLLSYYLISRKKFKSKDETPQPPDTPDGDNNENCITTDEAQDVFEDTELTKA
ncbi:MAG: MATE family efflux transporter [Clostridia bacterium]|nr:MATE family efflux transporter [Clostridia bacterium]